MDGILAVRPDDGWLWRGAEVMLATSWLLCYRESAVSAIDSWWRSNDPNDFHQFVAQRIHSTTVHTPLKNASPHQADIAAVCPFQTDVVIDGTIRCAAISCQVDPCNRCKRNPDAFLGTQAATNIQSDFPFQNVDRDTPPLADYEGGNAKTHDQ